MDRLSRIGELTLQYDRWNETMVMTKDIGTIYTRKELLDLMERCLEFYRYYDEQDIKNMNDQILERLNNPIYSIKATPKKEGYVYFIQAENGLTKIGETSDLKTRYKAIRDNVLIGIRLLFAVKSNDIRKLECELHEMFKEQRNKGEWFELTDGTLEALEKHFKKEGYEVVYMQIQ